MQGSTDRSSACDLGSTGQLLRSALCTLNAPSPFKESLRQQLVRADTAARPLARERRSGTDVPRAGRTDAPR